MGIPSLQGIRLEKVTVRNLNVSLCEVTAYNSTHGQTLMRFAFF